MYLLNWFNGDQFQTDFIIFFLIRIFCWKFNLISQPDLGVIYHQIPDKRQEKHKTLADKNGEEEGPANGRQVHLEKRDEKEYWKGIFADEYVEAFCFHWPCHRKLLLLNISILHFSDLIFVFVYYL